jgi:hypothetical protein
MVAAAMLDFGYRMFSGIVDVLLFRVATHLPNMNKICRKMNEYHKTFEMQDGGFRHFGFWLPGVSRYRRSVVIRIRKMPTKLGENW